MTSGWTNEAAIRRWNASATRQAMEANAEGGDFAKRHLINPALLRLLGARVIGGPGRIDRSRPG